MSEFNSLKIEAINRETPTAVSVQFNVPNNLSEAYQFIAGQYVTLKATINNQEVRRAYSICSSPSSGTLTVLVKEVPNGVFSTYVNHELQEGDSLEVAPPEGRFVFTPDSNSQQTHIAFAAGSGITPIISIVETALTQEQESTFILVYGNQSKEEAIFFDRLTMLQNKFPDRFHLEFVFSRFAFGDYKVGRIDAGLCRYFVNNKFSKHSVSDYFICGPGQMIDAITDTLKSDGVLEQHIHFERFTTAEAPKTDEALVDGMATVTYIVDDETTTVQAPTKKSILESAIKNDLDPPFSCQGGICSSCIARVTEGTVTMRQNQILTEAEVAEGLILTCQAHATSATVTIDYDDV